MVGQTTPRTLGFGKDHRIIHVSGTEFDCGSDWFAATRFPEGVTRITERGLGPLHACNIWLVAGRDATLLVDAGTGIAALAPVVARLTDRPVICLLTHAHYDHMGGAHAFADRRAHAAEAATMAAPSPQSTLWGGWLDAAAFTGPPPEGFDMEHYAVRPAHPTALLADGDVIDLGDRSLEVLHVPGHSPGLLAAFEAATGLLFSSDALYDGRMFFDLPGSGPAAASRSLDRLAALPARLVHPGHFESFTACRTHSLCDEQRRILRRGCADAAPPAASRYPA